MTPTTYFAPAGRAGTEVLAEQRALLRGAPLALQLLDAFPDPAFILNSHRQIVAGNSLLEQLVAADAEGVVGCRPGEALGCRNEVDGPDGCGTAIACRYCGAVQAIADAGSLRRPAVEDCRIRTQRNGKPVDLDVRVFARPVELQGTPFTVVTLRDLSEERRRMVYGSISIAEVQRSVDGLRAVLAGFPEAERSDAMGRQVRTDADSVLKELADELEAHRRLIGQGADSIVAAPRPFHLRSALAQIAARVRLTAEPAGRGIDLQLDEPLPESISTDELLLGRVVSMMLKLGIDATPRGSHVVLRASFPGHLRLSVEQPAPLSADQHAALSPRGTSGVQERSGSPIASEAHVTWRIADQHLGALIHFGSLDDGAAVLHLDLPRSAPTSPR